MQVKLINNNGFIPILSLACNICKGHGFGSESDIDKVIRVLRAGHLSIAEHVKLVFHVTDVSRVLMAQLTRHRHASFSIESQRSVTPTSVIIPETIKNNSTARDLFEKGYSFILDIQRQLRALGIPREDIRYISPEGSTTNILLSCNLRSFIEISQKRLCLQAQSEIRELFIAMRDIMVDKNPWLLEFLRPPCEACTDMRECPNRGK